MDRRQFISEGFIAAAGAQLALVHAPASPAAVRQTGPGEVGSAIAVLAELAFPEPASDRAAMLLAELATATRSEPGCRRYAVAMDVVDRGRFHLSELWDDLTALAAHFETPHMARFHSAARELGYAAPWMKQIAIGGIQDLNPRALRANASTQAGGASTGARASC